MWCLIGLASESTTEADVGDDLQAAQRTLTSRVMGKPGVSGTAIGQKRGEVCLMVYVSGDVAAGLVPNRVGGFPVVIEKTGTFRKL